MTAKHITELLHESLNGPLTQPRQDELDATQGASDEVRRTYDALINIRDATAASPKVEPPNGFAQKIASSVQLPKPFLSNDIPLGFKLSVASWRKFMLPV